MKRVVHIAKNSREAAAWNIRQCLRMTVEERQQAAWELKIRVYGDGSPDIREYHGK